MKQPVLRVGTTMQFSAEKEEEYTNAWEELSDGTRLALMEDWIVTVQTAPESVGAEVAWAKIRLMLRLLEEERNAIRIASRKFRPGKDGVL